MDHNLWLAPLPWTTLRWHSYIMIVFLKVQQLVILKIKNDFLETSLFI